MQTPMQKKLLRVLEKEPRYHNRTYELCASIEGIEIKAYGRTPDDCVRSFLVLLSEKVMRSKKSPKKEIKIKKQILFGSFAERWFHEVHRSRVIQSTYQADTACYRRHIAPTFRAIPIDEITSGDCIRFFEEFKEKKIERTRENCDGLMRQIFDYAIACELIDRNPMMMLKRVKKRRVNGVPLSKEEEREFLSALSGSKFELTFILALYTGLRPCELPSARIDGGFIVARNRKQKDVSRIVYKKIPITPMLQPYVEDLEEAMRSRWKELTPSHYLADVFHDFCDGHTLKDLRTTFSTRCQECSVPEQVVQIWMGHSPRTLLGNTYTKFSDEYLLSEGKKVHY